MYTKLLPERKVSCVQHTELADVHPDALRRTHAQIAPPSADELGIRTDKVLFPYSWLQNNENQICSSNYSPRLLCFLNQNKAREQRT